MKKYIAVASLLSLTLIHGNVLYPKKADDGVEKTNAEINQQKSAMRTSRDKYNKPLPSTGKIKGSENHKPKFSAGTYTQTVIILRK